MAHVPTSAQNESMSAQCVCKTSNETDLTCLVSMIGNAPSQLSPTLVWNRHPIQLNDDDPMQLKEHGRTEIVGLDRGLSLATLLDALEQCHDGTSASPIGYEGDDTLDLATLLDALKHCQDITSPIDDDDDDDDASVDSLSYYRRSGRLVQKNV